MRGALIFIYGVACYLAGFLTLLYLVGFVTNFVVPKSVDSGMAAPFAEALVVNLLLIVLFGVQHTVMARQGFKRWWKTIIPESMERSTYVLASVVVLGLLFWLWRPMPTALWSVDNEILRWVILGVCLSGFVIVFLSTFIIDHFELFGLKQVYRRLKEQPMEHPPFAVKWFYTIVRHPLMLGFLIFLWAAPTMTVGHLVLAGSMTVYIFIALVYEERDLVAFHGEKYEAYRREVPMVIPFLKGK